MGDILKQKDGKPWLTDKDEKVPVKCPKCGADMGLFFKGEPVFLCKGKDQHYFGTLKCTINESAYVTAKEVLE